MRYMATIQFDGFCMLCCRSVRFVLRFDKRKRYCFQMLPDSMSFRDLPPPGQAGGSVILIENGSVYRESAAVLRILTGLGFPWSILSIFRLVPSAFSDRIYRWISANRYRWFGRSSTCFVPDPSEADRFK